MTDVAGRTMTAVDRQDQDAPRHRRKKPGTAGSILPILWVVLIVDLAAIVVFVCVFRVASATLTGLLLVLVVFGFHTVFWSAVGIGRYLAEHLPSPMTRHQRGTADPIEADSPHRFRPDDVAVLIPAHNEATVLANSLRAASALLPVSNIHVVSDGSTDDTANVGRDFGVHVLELSPNRGKASALLEGIRHFELARNFAVVLFLDADTRPARDYLDTGLPEFDDPDVVAVAGRVRCLLDPPPRTRTGRFLVAYRSRLYAVVQLLVKYGQAARWANVVSIVPGFASMYRADVLARIDIAAPGLVIEDFNMTFEVHAKKLGRIAFRPGVAVAYTQDPDTLHDYVRQIRRWSLGFWQTVRLHGAHTGLFWVVLAVQIAELLSSSVILLCMLPLMLFAVYSNTLAHTYGYPRVMGRELVGALGPQYVLIGFLLPDLLLTAFAAIALRRRSLLLLAPLFPAMRLVDAYVCLRSIPSAWRTHSSGTWVSPDRRAGPSPAPGCGPSRGPGPRTPAELDQVCGCSDCAPHSVAETPHRHDEHRDPMITARPPEVPPSVMPEH